MDFTIIKEINSIILTLTIVKNIARHINNTEVVYAVQNIQKELNHVSYMYTKKSNLYISLQTIENANLAFNIKPDVQTWLNESPDTRIKNLNIKNITKRIIDIVEKLIFIYY